MYKLSIFLFFITSLCLNLSAMHQDINKAIPQTIPTLYQMAFKKIALSNNPTMPEAVACVTNSFETLIKPLPCDYGKDEEAKKALADAIDQKNYGTFYSIIHNVDPLLLKSPYKGLVPMQRAIQTNNLHMVRKLIGKGIFPFTYHVQGDANEQMKQLVQSNLMNGTLPIFSTARYKKPEDIKELIRKGAYLNAVHTYDNTYKSVLDHALEAKCSDNIKCLVELGARIEDRHLEMALVQGTEFFNYLVQNIDKNQLKSIIANNKTIADAIAPKDNKSEINTVLITPTHAAESTNEDNSYDYKRVNTTMKNALQVFKEWALESNEYNQVYESLIKKCSNPRYKINIESMRLLNDHGFIGTHGDVHDLVIDVMKEEIKEDEEMKRIISDKKMRTDYLRSALANFKKR